MLTLYLAFYLAFSLFLRHRKNPQKIPVEEHGFYWLYWKWTHSNEYFKYWNFLTAPSKINVLSYLRFTCSKIKTDKLEQVVDTFIVYNKDIKMMSLASICCFYY